MATEESVEKLLALAERRQRLGDHRSAKSAVMDAIKLLEVNPLSDAKVMKLLQLARHRLQILNESETG